MVRIVSGWLALASDEESEAAARTVHEVAEDFLKQMLTERFDPDLVDDNLMVDVRGTVRPRAQPVGTAHPTLRPAGLLAPTDHVEHGPGGAPAGHDLAPKLPDHALRALGAASQEPVLDLRLAGTVAQPQRTDGPRAC